ncbi:TPA: hypothetical protein JBI42_04110 [Legionella pneumophila]|uniref:Uncharacterized protein n=1 Tax=Legionella israelensis TaxID=454 RepID=A0A0W0V2K4_9GAMM|nr:hypothetical protein Lisr_2565 [Legionella israelensis]CZP18535.1 Uncharacterised protein [Legionella pneumophila]SCY11794.1 hypothetical protein SAMN02746069_01350 [Legionella israelensis DSM 19235]QBS09763.1 hypothetical protein E4T55_07775 [Legionella israelensis]CZP48308.1 Uncharacterised protein [Legionella pneumophila]
MEHHSRLNIYKGMIQYILDSTHYTLKHIAQLSHSSLDNIRMIYCHDSVPNNFKSEVELMKLYQIVLEINMNKDNCSLVG